jgi:hypothetical protein
MSLESDANPVAEASEATPEASAEEVLESVDNANEASSEESADVSEASDSELEDVLDDEDASSEEKAEAAKELSKRISMKINGQEEEFDLSNDEHIEKLKQMAQKGEGADRKFQDAASIQKKMEQFAKILQSDPIEALRRAGHDIDALTEGYMAKKIEEMQKDPKELEMEKLQKQLQERDEMLKKIEEEKIAAEQARIQEEYQRQLDQEITEGLESSNLPKSPYVVKRIAENLMLAIDNGYEDVSVSDVLPIVEEQIQGEIRQMFEALPEDVIEQILGDDVSTKLRKRRLKKMKETKAASSVKATGQAEIKKAQAESEKKSEKVSAKDFFSNFGDL